MNVEQRYYLKSMLCIGNIWIIGILAMIYSLSYKDTDFFKFGPGNATFLQIKIDSWEKWIMIMIYSFLSQVINSLMNATVYTFIINVIRDYKSPWEGSIIFGQYICILCKVFNWVNEICEVFLVLTLQLQYWIPGFIADIAVSIFTTNKYLKDKVNNDIYDMV